MKVQTDGTLTARQLKLILAHLDDEQLDYPVWLYGQTEVVSVEVKWSYLNKRAEIVLEGRK